MLELGATASLVRCFTKDEVAKLSDLCSVGDNDSRFLSPAQQYVPAPLIAAMFSNLLGTQLPGPGTNYLKQSISWHRNAHFDEPLTASVTLTRLRREKFLVDLRTMCIGGDGTTICEGRALVQAQDVAQAF